MVAFRKFSTFVWSSFFFVLFVFVRFWVLGSRLSILGARRFSFSHLNWVFRLSVCGFAAGGSEWEWDCGWGWLLPLAWLALLSN